MAEVRLTDIRKSYGSLEVIKGVNLEVSSGEFVVFVGPSGCGKSTLLRMIAGLEDISSGELTIGGTVMNDVDPSKRGIAMVFQTYALYPHMTVRENMGFALRFAGMAKDEIEPRVNAAAKILELDALMDRKPKALSGGQRQRVAIGRAIVRQPDVFLFDEPLSNLDAELRVHMRVEIARLHKELNATIVYVTHDQVEAMTLSDRVVVLDKGKVSQFGTPLELFYQPANLFVAGFIGSPRMNFVEATVAGQDGAAVMLSGAGLKQPVVFEAEGVAALSGGSKVTLGIRPDKIEIVPAGEGALVGTVRLVERLGTESHVHLSLEDGRDFTAVVRGTHPVANGETVHLRLPAQHCYLFDAEGRAVRRRLDAETQALIVNEKGKRVA